MVLEALNERKLSEIHALFEHEVGFYILATGEPRLVAPDGRTRQWRTEALLVLLTHESRTLRVPIRALDSAPPNLGTHTLRARDS